MKIVYFLAHPDGVGGASKVMIKHASMMGNLGHDIVLVIQNDEHGSHSSEIDSVCNDYDLETCSLSYPVAVCIEEIDIVSCMDVIGIIEQLISEHKPDLVHSLQLNVAVEIACRKLNIPHVMSIYPLAKGMFDIRWTNIFPRFIIGDSYYYTKQWGEGLGAESKCIRVGYDVKGNAETGVTAEYDYEFLCVGVFVPYKNQMEVIKFAELANDNGFSCHVTFLGNAETTYGRECDEYVKNHDLTDIVTFRGFVVDVEKYFNAADALIHVSEKESYPGVIVEAMANRTPIMISPTGGVSELVRDGENGFYIDGFFAIDIWNTFKKYIDCRTKDLLQRIVEHGYATYLNHHTYEKIAAELESFYLEIIDRDDNHSDFRKLEATLNTFKVFYRNHENYSQYTLKHLWYIWHLKRVVTEHNYKTASIWGAGTLGKYAYEWCRILKLEVVSFLDTYKKGQYFGIDIKKPTEKSLKEADVVFVGVADFDMRKDISTKLEQYGAKRNINYFCILSDPCM